ncbi:hypothetical protein DFH07DRAFT_739057 [Mycena maculata]|uniref:Uncharacterized protein n=1 Tax=Mycena maculata TaxID=230809 RepID=A0AAD7JDX0_9AGAR|nr:hypothetical protein DFH07DRAFT_739057 [Mycena maculata]
MNFNPVLTSLEVPPDFNRYKDIPELDVIARLDRWKEAAIQTLRELKTRIQQEQASLSLKQQADIISAATVFEGDDAWVAPDSRVVAHDILHRFSAPPLPLIVQVLQYNVKPLFRSNPHPSLNLETGRKLARPAGGPMASQDFYDGQTWKEHPGASNIVIWCVRHIPSTAYEELWHLVIPPVMALLDDYEARYKLMGVRITTLMLERVPASVLKRTGVDSLLIAALNRSLTQLQSPETPVLLPAAISSSLTLIQLMTSVGSADRFDQLCALLGDGIIGSIWPYASDRLEALLASIEALPVVVEALGVGCARYLKVLIAQLVHPLVPLEYEKTSVALQISSLRALSAVINACPERMTQWKGTILNAVGRCWVGIVDSKATSPPDELKQELKNVCHKLAVACPSVLQEEYPRFMAADAEIFKDLLGETGRNSV